MTSILETAARRLASQGPEKIDEFQSVVDRARRILDLEGLDALRAESATVAVAVAVVEPFGWEMTSPSSVVRKVPFMAAVEDGATGQGLTAYFYAAPCRDADEVRRHLSRYVGRHLANTARVTPFSEPLPSASFFLSPKLTDTLTDLGKGTDGPGALSFFAEYHMNYG